MVRITNKTLGWIICSLAAIFYCYEYLLRIAPSVMVSELMQAFQVNATQLGLLSAFFYFVYTPMQLVVGILSDLYGPRRILTVAVITCTLGSYLFSMASSLIVAAIGRSFIGFGSAFAFVCVLKLAASWLPQRFFAFFAGLATMLGMLGAIFQVTIFSGLVHSIGWQQTINVGTYVGVVLIPLVWFIVRDKPTTKHTRTLTPQYKETFIGFLKILKKPQMWLNGVIAGLMYLSLSLFAELWGIPFLSNVYHLPACTASVACSMVYLGWLVGSPLIGYISDITSQRRLPILLGCLLSAILVGLIIFLPSMNIKLLHVVLFLFGLFSSCEVLCFAVSSENAPKPLVATATAFTNFLIVLGGFIFQPMIGIILDIAWSGQIVDNIRVYSPASYQLAFIVLPIFLIIGFILSFWLHEAGKNTP